MLAIPHIFSVSNEMKRIYHREAQPGLLFLLLLLYVSSEARQTPVWSNLSHKSQHEQLHMPRQINCLAGLRLTRDYGVEKAEVEVGGGKGLALA